MKNILHRMLSGSLLMALFLSLAAPSMTQATEVPESGIDYTKSYLHFTYVDDILGGPVNIPGSRQCFEKTLSDLTVFDKQLSELGVTSSNGLMNIIDGEDSGCFQKSGTYYMQFLLKDNAGNCGWYPHGSTECIAYDPTEATNKPSAGGGDHPHWYKFVVKPATPDADNTTFVPSTGEVRANGNEFYTVDITFRDEFGNVVTQLTDPDDVTVKVATDASGIFVDGILTAVPDNSEITTDEEAYKNTGSETTFVEGVKLGDTNGTKVTLASLLGSGGTLPSSTLTNVSPGVFRFEVSSDVPSMKLFDSSSTNVVDAGVYKQPLDFDTETAQIENDGSVGSTKEGLLSGTVSAVFAFHPIFQAIPGALGSNVTWGETAGLITNLVFNSSETNSEKYLLLTPFIDYFLQKYTPPSGLIPESYDNVKLPFVGTGTGDNTETDIAFFPAVGDVASSPPSNIGLAAQVQYEIGGKTIRHVSGDNSGACPSGEYEKCFLFDPSTSARIIGADIEGAFQGERSEVLVYQLAGSTGDQTSYAGTINNDRLRNGLFKSIDNAVRNPQTELTGPQNLALNSGATGLTFGDNDTIVVRGDLILGDGDSTQGENFNAPSGAPTELDFTPCPAICFLTSESSKAFSKKVIRLEFNSGDFPIGKSRVSKLS